MKRLEITIKNYRAFSEEQPLRFQLGDGLTAFVGRNNSGKSAAMLFFYEFRNLFDQLKKSVNNTPGILDIFIKQRGLRFNYNGTSDPAEIFHSSNSRPLTIELFLPDAAIATQGCTDCLSRIVAKCDRINPTAWQFETYAKASGSENLTQTMANIYDSRAVAVSNQRICVFDFRKLADLLTRSKYYGPFRNAINEGAGTHYDLTVGTGFVDLWDKWKNAGNRTEAQTIQEITDNIRNLFEFEKLEINASRALKTLMVIVDNKPHRLNELGSGIAQFIIALGNAATEPAPLIFIDEPESNLHPSLQIDFLLSLARHATDGVVFSTHSIGLARSTADRIYSFQKNREHTVVRPFETTPNYLEFVGELSFSTFREMGADRLLLVEGVHDVKVVQQFLRLVKKEHTTVVLPLGGDQLASGDREHELNELLRISSNIHVLVDSERDAASSPPISARQKFAESCTKLGFKTCVTQRRAIENYFTEAAIQAEFGSTFQALQPYDRLGDAKLSWSKGANWKIARRMTLSDLESTDIGIFLKAL